jgi:hypothetical protein
MLRVRSDRVSILFLSAFTKRSIERGVTIASLAPNAAHDEITAQSLPGAAGKKPQQLKLLRGKRNFISRSRKCP